MTFAFKNKAFQTVLTLIFMAISVPAFAGICEPEFQFVPAQFFKALVDAQKNSAANVTRPSRAEVDAVIKKPDGFISKDHASELKTIWTRYAIESAAAFHSAEDRIYVLNLMFSRIVQVTASSGWPNRPWTAEPYALTRPSSVFTGNDKETPFASLPVGTVVFVGELGYAVAVTPNGQMYRGVFERNQGNDRFALETLQLAKAI